MHVLRPLLAAAAVAEEAGIPRRFHPTKCANSFGARIYKYANKSSSSSSDRGDPPKGMSFCYFAWLAQTVVLCVNKLGISVCPSKHRGASHCLPLGDYKRNFRNKKNNMKNIWDLN